METPRFNVFNQIHKALRAMMFETVLKLQQTDMQDWKQADTVLEMTESLLEIFDAHAYYEDTYILAAADEHDPAMIKEFESEHETDLELTRKLREKIACYRGVDTPWEKLAGANMLYYALNDFVAFNLKHMNKEEQLLNKMLWSNYTDAEIMEMEHRIQQDIPAEKMPVYFKWMIKGINDSELNAWLNAVKAGAPAFVYNGLVEACRVHLHAERFRLIEEVA